MTDVDTIRQKINDSLKPAYLEVIDQSDGCCGLKIKVTVVSELFNGKKLLDCHHMIYDALKEEMPLIHALSIVSKTPEQWKKANGAAS
uniref:BolA-like protein n=1 Tax=Trichuris muris TaxID=70415 RepID=A0A5S6QIB9_TRIMR